MVVVVDGIRHAMLVHMLVHLFASYPQIQQVFRWIPRVFSCSTWPQPLFFRAHWMLVHMLVHASLMLVHMLVHARRWLFASIRLGTSRLHCAIVSVLLNAMSISNKA